MPKPTLQYSPNTALDKSVLNKYMDLPMPDNICQIKYVWIDQNLVDIHAKTRTLDFIPTKVEEIPMWDTAKVEMTSDVALYPIYLHPVSMYKDPFRPGNNKLVLCDTYTVNKQPTVKNYRHSCMKVTEATADQKPWFGIEQEYTLLDVDLWPLGWPKYGYLDPHRCLSHTAVGANKMFGRDIVEAHYRACIYAGIQISGSNAECMPAQWEYQVGPCEGISIADDLWMSRFILHRIAEDFGVVVSFEPKPWTEGWIGSGAHCNFSTKAMREDNGIVEIEKAVEKLSKHHRRHIEVYDLKGGKDNEERLDGNVAGSTVHTFTSGVAVRDVSVRIPLLVAEKKKGYLEDRRPASNSDPYRVIEALLRTCCLES